MEQRESSSVVFGNSGWGWDDIQPEELQCELQLVCAMYDDGRMEVKQRHATRTDVDEKSKKATVKLSLTLSATIPLSCQLDDGDEQQQQIPAVTLLFACPRGYLSPIEEGDDGEKVALVASVDSFSTSPKVPDEVVDEMQQNINVVVVEHAQEALPVMLRVVSDVQEALDRWVEEENAAHQPPLESQDDVDERKDEEEEEVIAPPSAMMSLPHDCWFIVGQFLDPIETTRAASVSSWLHYFLNDNDTLWEYFFHHRFPVVANIFYQKDIDDLEGEKETTQFMWIFADWHCDIEGGYGEETNAINYKALDKLLSQYAPDDTSHTRPNEPGYKDDYVYKQLKALRSGEDDHSSCVLPMDWRASYRYAALEQVVPWFVKTPFRDAFRDSKFDNDGGDDYTVVERYNHGDLLPHSTEETDLLQEALAIMAAGNRYLFGSTNLPKHAMWKLEEDVTAQRDLVRGTFWNGVYHRTTNADVKRIAHFQANYWTQNFNIALSLLNSNMNHYSKISKKKRAKLDFPTDDEGLQSLKSAVLMKSLDHDVEKETDSTLQKVVVVKRRDIRTVS